MPVPPRNLQSKNQQHWYDTCRAVVGLGVGAREPLQGRGHVVGRGKLGPEFFPRTERARGIVLDVGRPDSVAG